MKKNLELIRSLKCSVCWSSPPNEAHHWRSRGAGGTDDLTNLCNLCHRCHMIFHTIGQITFWERHGDQITTFRKLHGLPELVTGVEAKRQTLGLKESDEDNK